MAFILFITRDCMGRHGIQLTVSDSTSRVRNLIFEKKKQCAFHVIALTGARGNLLNYRSQDVTACIVPESEEKRDLCATSGKFVLGNASLLYVNFKTGVFD